MASSTMSREIYTAIKSQQFARIWKAITTEIMPQLVKDEYYVVPYPKEAKACDLFTVYDKFHPSTMAKIFKKGRTYRYLGNFLGMVDMNSSSSTARNTVFTVCESTVFGIPKDFLFETSEEGFKRKTKKTMTFEVKNSKKRWGYVDTIDKQQIKWSKEFPEKMKRIYVINEVFVADKMTVKATADVKEKTWNFDEPIVLAFKFIKLKKGKDGFFAKVDKFDTLPRWSDLEKIQWDKPDMKNTPKSEDRPKDTKEEE